MKRIIRYWIVIGIVFVGLMVGAFLAILTNEADASAGQRSVIEQAYGQIASDGGLVPDDMCYSKDGEPIIFDSSIAGLGTGQIYSFSYLTQGGNVVTIEYEHDLLSAAYHATNIVKLSGAKCPTS